MSFYLQKHPGLRFHAEYNLSWQQFHLWLADQHHDGPMRRCTNLVMTSEEDDPGKPWEPTMKLSEAEVQALMDTLWAAGVRPSDQKHKHDDGPIAAIKDEVISAKDGHIEDLRRVAFNDGTN